MALLQCTWLLPMTVTVAGAGVFPEWKRNVRRQKGFSVQFDSSSLIY